MSKHDFDKWSQRYAQWRYQNDNGSAFLRDWLPKLPIGRALDVACGPGRNALVLAVEAAPTEKHKAKLIL